MEWETHLKNIRWEKKRVREAQDGFLKQLGLMGGGWVWWGCRLTGKVLSTLGHEAPEVMGHLSLSHLHAKRRACWFFVELTTYPKALRDKDAFQSKFTSALP